MTLIEFTDQVKAAAGKMPNLGKSLKLSLDGGTVHIDLTGDEAIVSNEDKCPTGIVTFITSGPPKDRFEYMYNTVYVFEYFNVPYEFDRVKLKT